MLEFQEKRKLKKFFYSKTILIILVIFVVLLLNSVWKVYIKQGMTEDNLVKTTANLKNLQTREKMLSSEIDRLKTESGIEQEIRERYSLVKPGEEMIVLVVEGETSDSSAASPIGFWQRVLDWLK